MATQMIHARIDQNLKQDTDVIFRALGINTADAIRMFLTQVILNQGLPFDVKIPNKETREAIEDARLNRNLTRISLDELDKLFDD